MLRRVLRRTSELVASSVDRAVVRAFLARGADEASPERIAAYARHIESMEEGAERLAVHGYFRDEPSAFFSRPGTIYASEEVVRRGRDILVSDLCWRSRYEAFYDEIAPDYLRDRANHDARMRLWRRDDGRSRPVALLVHGYCGGRLDVEGRIWPIESLMERGFDVAVLVLPHHASRRGEDVEGRLPLFPHPDGRFTVEGIRQAIFDARAAMQVLERRGARKIGAVGMSLGGYTVGLLATVEPELAFAVPVIPLACFADWNREMRTLVGSPERKRRHYRAIERLTRAISPLERPAAIQTERIHVVAASVDRITPNRHAERLAEHFGAPLRTFRGGHLLQFGLEDALEEVASATMVPSVAD
jgi:esterase/lipase